MSGIVQSVIDLDVDCCEQLEASCPLNKKFMVHFRSIHSKNDDKKSYLGDPLPADAPAHHDCCRLGSVICTVDARQKTRVDITNKAFLYIRFVPRCVHACVLTS